MLCCCPKLMSKWLFLSRVVSNIKDDLQPLEDAIRTSLLPLLTKKLPPNDAQRKLFALPARLGGMGIRNSVKQAASEFEASIAVTRPLVKAILSGSFKYSYNVLSD